MGIMIFKCVVPYLIGQKLWNDMGTAEDVLVGEPEIYARTTIVRPTNMWPPSENPTFSEAWRKEGGENLAYVTRRADESPPNIWMNRRAIAKCLLDCVVTSEFDGTAISLFQGDASSSAPQSYAPLSEDMMS
jgi:hypothetical protein